MAGSLASPTGGSGAIKPYVFEAERRSAILPEVPTAREAGPPEFQVLAWNAVFAPKATPKPIVDELTNALDRALDDYGVRKRFFDLTLEIPDKASRGQQPLAALVRSDMRSLAGRRLSRRRASRRNEAARPVWPLWVSCASCERKVLACCRMEMSAPLAAFHFG